MNIRITKKDLLKGLQLVQGVVERRSTMPILSNVLLEAKEKALIVTGTDLEVGVNGELPATTLREGRVAVHARGLYDVVKELPDEPVTLGVDTNNWVEISCGRSRFRLAGLAPEEFPALPKKSDGTSLKLDCSTLSHMIEKTSFAMSTDETRYNLNGILFQCSGEGGKSLLRMVATDGHRLSCIEKPLENGSQATKAVIVPRKGVQELKRLLDGGDGTFELWIDAKHAIATREHTSLTIRLIDGQFPPYQQVIPKQCKRTLSVPREAMAQAVKRVSAMTTERSRGMKFSISPKNLEISSTNPDFGEAREELEATYQGDPFVVGFNARYMLDALLALEDDKVVFQLGDDTAPCLLKSEADRGFTHVLMPMRL